MFALASEPIDTAALVEQLDDVRAGARVVFEGRVRIRNEGRSVDALEYEAYLELAEKEGRRILEDAARKFSLLHATCVHRVGRLAPGDLAVWAGVAAEHRAGAFAACAHIIDEVKARVPIWKKEHYSDGDSGWINSAVAVSEVASHERPD